MPCRHYPLAGHREEPPSWASGGAVQQQWHFMWVTCPWAAFNLYYLICLCNLSRIPCYWLLIGAHSYFTGYKYTDHGNLEAELTSFWHVPQTPPEQCLQCGRVHNSAQWGPLGNTVAMKWCMYLVCKKTWFIRTSHLFSAPWLSSDVQMNIVGAFSVGQGSAWALWPICN